MNQKHLPFILLTLAVVLVFVVGRLVCYNMFLDGVLYNSVAHNLAHGRGSFWFPHFAKNTMPFFHEQPPLTFYIESLFFRISDSLWTERVYSFTTLAVNTWLITRIWSIIAPNLREFFWLPILFWLTIPCVNFAFSNCLEENTMSIFVLWAVLLQSKVIFEQKSYFYSLGAGGLLMLAALCKGFPGLFPFAFFGCAWLFGLTSFRATFSHSLAVFTTFAILAFALYLYPPSNESLGAYLNERVFNSIKNVSCQDTRLWIFGHLCNGLKPLIIATTLLVAIVFYLKQSIEIDFKKAQIFFLLGLLGTLPLMVTREQRGQYLVTAIPYFALAFGLLTAPILAVLFEKINNKTSQIITIFASIITIFAGGYALNNIGKTYELGEKVNDFFILEKAIPAYSEVQIPEEMWNDWDLQTALNRSSFIDLNGKKTDSLTYLLIQKNSKYIVPIGYNLQKLPTQYYDLYKKQ